MHSRAHHFESLEVLTLGSQLLLQVFQLLHLPGRDNELLPMVLRVDLFFFLLLLVHQVKSFLLVLKLSLHPDLAQRQMILKPLVLVLVIHEVG